MKRLLVNELSGYINSEVTLKGWVHRIRDIGKIAFLLLRDRSGIVQCVINNSEINIKGLKLESVVEISGKLVENKTSADGFELQVTSLSIISKVKEDLPIEINKQSMEASLDTILNNRVISLRNPKLNAVFKIQAALSQAFAGFLIQQGFTQVYTSKIVAEGTEGGTELFKVKYFDREAFLAQSPQFYKQMMVGAGYERVFEIGHVYRAESHDTKRHINEFISLDLEMGFIENQYEIMEMETELLRYMMRHVSETCAAELKLLEASLPVIQEEIPKFKLSEAIEIIRQQYGKSDLENDIDHEGEMLISKYVKEKFGSDFVFITHYPKTKKPMYTMPAENGETHSFDLLFKGLEITSGGQRIHEYEQLVQNMIEYGLEPSRFESYLSVFKYGMPPHGGFAIGLERLTAMLLNFENVREATLFTRDKHRLAP